MSLARSSALLALLACAALGQLGPSAAAQPLQDDGGASWRLEQPPPPAPPPGVQGSPTPVGLGRIGDIEFWAPNRGLLITAGNGSTIPAGLWAYDGRGWHELSIVCGASDGRIAWAGPDEFWTVSDGRPGQAPDAHNNPPPLEDNTLCHFAGGQVVGSYASLAFRANSYRAMHAAGCIAAGDCWFAGDPLPAPQVGSFHLRWNGSSLTAQPYAQESYAVQDARAFQGQLYESVQVLPPILEEPHALHLVNRKGVVPTFEALFGLPLYGSEEFPSALDFVHLSAGEEALWGAAGPVRETPSGSTPGQVTVVRYAQERWSQVLGPATEPSGAAVFPGDVVDAIAAEPGSGGAWLALDTQEDAEQPSPTAPALVARVGADGSVSAEDIQRLPSQEGIGPKGAASKIACPAPHDCWLATTQGWLFHLTDGKELPQDTDPAFSHLITERPADEGIPQTPPDTPPIDDSGLLGEPPASIGSLPESPPSSEEKVTVPLLSHIRTRLVHGSTLEFSFQLAVKAHIRLLAKRRHRLVASTPMRTFVRGRRKLLLRLDPRRWPTKLQLQTHALAPLPTVTPSVSQSGTVGTAFVALPRESLLPPPGVAALSARYKGARRARRRALGVLALAAGVAMALAGIASSPNGAPHAAAQSALGEPTPQTDNSVPVPNMTMIGASPAEAPGETWGVGEPNEGTGEFPSVLVRYTTETGWTLGPGFLDGAGKPLAGFKLYAPDGSTPSPLAGEMTVDGAGALAGELPPHSSGEATRQVVLVRNPGGVFQEAPMLEEGPAALKPEETLFGVQRAPLLVALDEGAGKAGALVVPVKRVGVEDSVLHWDGSAWTREAIQVPPASSTDFRVLAVGASAPGNAWLLAQLSSSSSYPVGAVALFRRHPASGGEAASWRPVAFAPGSADGEAHPLTANGRPFAVPRAGEPPTVLAQVLTVTGEGVWVDGQRTDVHASTTLFFKPEGEDVGRVAASWCTLPAGAPSGTPPCDHGLPEPLPTGPSRSLAWANPATPGGLGERVVTGLPEGVSLRLDGTSFTRVLALGGGPESFPGGAYGAAFSNPREGWLGVPSRLPVHLTLHPVASRLTPWPVSFRHALLAVAPQPGAPVGSLSSEALAVGDRGEVARYEPGKGWMPESLLGAGGRHETPRLRAVAWPTPSRAYAVGDEGQMWLWRGETGLWEPDPATPFNFRGNLMGVAFDPGNPARGYAVGESGVLLRYGKSWTQEEALPPEAQGASFTAIAFAGSEAVVAYRKLLDRTRSSSYVGGLLVNDGSGWRVDAGAATAMGSQIPLTVAGLADGGAAFAARSFSSGGGATIFERDSPGATWQPVSTPFPGGGSPGSLALFREAGALRAVASGSAPAGFDVESVQPSPPGFPPPLIAPYGLGSNLESGVLRQTSSGWSDEQHELNNAREPPGEYSFYDTVYEPDPISTVLIDPSGAQGWAVGGFVDNEHGGVLDTADIERYPADGVAPTGLGTAPVALDPTQATFAIGGGSQCAAPCADRAAAAVGPDVWLTAALHRAGTIGARAFFYTGPRVTTGETVGPPTLPIPYGGELERYAAILGSSPIPAFAALSPTDLDGARSESTFEQSFAGFPKPFGGSEPQGSELTPAGRSSEACTGMAGCQSTYYALDSHGAAGSVRAIVLDTGGDVGSTQRSWLAGELAGAKQANEPAIVIGNADLNAQIAAGDGAAAATAQILLADGASAYFFDSPERNVALPLRIGADSIPTFGSGTLGYVKYNAESSGEFLGASGFLLAQVDFAKWDHATNRAVVAPRLIPNVGELALEAKDGTLLRRSRPALFDGLARRPRSGNRSTNKQLPSQETDPYIPIPSICVGTACANGIFPEYTFSSSRPDVGDFVEPNLAAADPRAVLLGPGDKPIPDPQSGLFCAYNAGTTIVTISAGGMSSSLPVTVQAGSVRRPCGTQPLKELPTSPSQAPAPPPAPAPTPGGSPAPASAPPPIPLPPPPVVPPVPAPVPAHAAPPHPFLPLAAPAAALLPFVPLPVPTPARPTPPSGTSAVTSPVEAPQREEEDEEATESARADAVAYRQTDQEPIEAYVLGVVVLAAFAGAAVRGRPRRGRGDVRVAPATLSTLRAHRRMSRPGRPGR
jgi:hypothetical protein